MAGQLWGGHESPPPANVGKKGDFYLELMTGICWEYIDKEWVNMDHQLSPPPAPGHLTILSQEYRAARHTHRDNNK